MQALLLSTKKQINDSHKWLSKKNVLGKGSQVQKSIYCIILFMWHFRKDNLSLESRSLIALRQVCLLQIHWGRTQEKFGVI